MAILKIYSQKCYYGDPFQKFLAKFLSGEKKKKPIVGTCMWYSCSIYPFSHYQAYALLQEIGIGWSIPNFICTILIHQNYSCGNNCMLVTDFEMTFTGDLFKIR